MRNQNWIQIKTTDAYQVHAIFSHYEKEGYRIVYPQSILKEVAPSGYLQKIVDWYKAIGCHFIIVKHPEKVMEGNSGDYELASRAISYHSWLKKIDQVIIGVGDTVRLKKSANNRYIVKAFLPEQEYYACLKEVSLLKQLTGVIQSITNGDATVKFSDESLYTIPVKFFELAKGKTLIEVFEKEEAKKEDIAINNNRAPLVKTIKVEAIQCLHCEDIIFSRNRHDFRWCSCGKVAIDGGRDYTKLCGDLEDLSEILILEVPISDLGDKSKSLIKKTDPRPKIVEVKKQDYTPKEYKVESPVEEKVPNASFFLFDKDNLGLVRNPEILKEIQYPCLSSSNQKIDLPKMELQFREFAKAVVSKWPMTWAESLMGELLDAYKIYGNLKRDPERIAIKVGGHKVEILK